VALAFALVSAILRYWLLRLRGSITLEQRAQWVQKTCRDILHGAGIRYRIEGQPPTQGLVVANHLSYLDILIISAAMPCFFVAKMEIGNWFFFGKAARVGGTLFLNRTSMASANDVARQIGERLKQRIPVLLFPEGTSTDGSTVLRFHSLLIHPAILARAPITTAALSYVIDRGIPERELCWYDDALFVTHLMKALGTPGFTCVVRFGQSTIYDDRRIAVSRTHAEVTAMRALIQQR
jgi:1-acyl-sn-glycerol-3-phosphate acyltransferase